MDNIERFPNGWQDDHRGIPINNLYPEIFRYDGLSAVWNKQGRMVDISAQMAFFAKNLIGIAELTEHKNDIEIYSTFYTETKATINNLCWNEEDAFYYDLGYSKQIKRKHIGMFWVLIAEIVPEERLKKFLSHLTNPAEFWRRIPVASTPADQKEFSGAGNYWRGSVWVPTNYMILLGLLKYDHTVIAQKLAHQYYAAVAEVYKKTGTFWENYAPDLIDKGSQSRPDFCGWTGIVPITIYREFIK
jgi:neutral trehalase